MEDFVMKCGTLIDGTGKAPMKDAVILVKKGRIARVEKNKHQFDNFLWDWHIY